MAGQTATPAPFARPTEAEAYRLLHTQGLQAFDERYQRIGTDLINRWADKRLVRVSHTPQGLVVKTFNKYAR